MRLISSTVAAAAFALLSTGFATAATSPDEVLDSCPTSVTLGCAGAVRDFVDANEVGPELNDQLKQLAAELAYRARNPATSLVSCLEIRDGIRVAAEGMSLPAPRASLLQTAAQLCRSDDAPQGSAPMVISIL